MSIPMMPDLTVTPIRGVAFTVEGVPAPQGSKSATVRGGKAVMFEDNKKTEPWRADVTAAAVEAMDGALPFDAPVEVIVTFSFVLPRTVKNRPYPSVRPDVDKLARAVLDGLTAGGVFTDDARVVDLHARKRYAAVAGAEITVREVAA